MIKKLNELLSTHDKKFLLLLIIFSIFISFVEMLGISVIMPFIAVVTDFTLIDNNVYYAYIYNFFGFSSKVNFCIVFGILLICFYIFRSAINLLYAYVLAKFSRGRYHIFATRIFENYLLMSYRDYIDKNSSEANRAIINEAEHLTIFISNCLSIIVEVFVIILIYTLMLVVNWKITFLLSTIILFCGLFLLKIIIPINKKIGEKRSSLHNEFFKIIAKTFNNFKILKSRENNNELFNDFSKLSNELSSVGIKYYTLSGFPRLFLEGMGFCIVVAIMLYWLIKYQGNISAMLPVLSIFVLGLYRLLPSANRIITSYQNIFYYAKSLDIVHENIFFPRENYGEEKIDFKKEILIKNISFEYIKDKLVLKDINFSIQKGDSVAFIGESGSGKSTLVDIVNGLYLPNSGSLEVDGVLVNNDNLKSWRKKFGYIPQNIYLFDSNIACNVAMSSSFDEKIVKKVLKKANILEFLEKEHEGIYTNVGESGIKLSGGQKQRIAIARALYHDPEILILDEATSALDNNTEEKIMEEIYKASVDKTLIIIAHRLSTITKCNKIFMVEDGKIYLKSDTKI